MKICISAIIKNENHYLREWVEHYKSIGIDHIFLYDNNDALGEKPSDVIQDYINEGFVSIDNTYRGEKSIPTNANKNVPRFQVSSYLMTYNKIVGKYDYMLICDIDELLVFNNDFTNIKDYIESLPKDIDVICINWVLYNDNNLVRVENDDYSMMSRFNGSCVVADAFKSIVKVYDFLGSKMFSCHTMYARKKLKYADSNGNPINVRLNQISNKNKVSDICQMNHYKSKTLQEFVENKLMKWKDWDFTSNGKFGSLDAFFKFNDITDEKLEYLEMFMNETKDTRIKKLIGTFLTNQKNKSTQNL